MVNGNIREAASPLYNCKIDLQSERGKPGEESGEIDEESTRRTKRIAASDARDYYSGRERARANEMRVSFMKRNKRRELELYNFINGVKFFLTKIGRVMSKRL